MSLLASRVDGAASDRIPLDDRGLLYGDGLFETILLHRGRAVWWREHLDRLLTSARRLGIDCPAEAVWQADLDAMLADSNPPPRAVLRVSLTRGSSGRGYAVPDLTADLGAAGSRRLLALYAAPAAKYVEGLRLRTCSLRLSAQPALAGIKHLNRLEQVLARLEWRELEASQRQQFDEGLLLDAAGHAVCTTLGNLLWRDAEGWHTPPIVDCGIAGICRGELIDRGWVDERPLAETDRRTVLGLAVCNSVRGILPVISLDGVVLPQHQVSLTLRDRLIEQEPAFDF